MLEQEGIPYMALDLDPDRVRLAAAAGDSVAFGDCGRLQALMAAGLARASAVVVTYLDEPGALKLLTPRAPMRHKFQSSCAPGRSQLGETSGRRRHRSGA